MVEGPAHEFEEARGRDDIADMLNAAFSGLLAVDLTKSEKKDTSPGGGWDAVSLVVGALLSLIRSSRR